MSDVTLTISGDYEDPFKNLLRLIAWMDICSSIGHNSKFNVEFYGDWTARFKFKILEGSAEYQAIKEELAEEYVEGKWGSSPEFVIY